MQSVGGGDGLGSMLMRSGLYQLLILGPRMGGEQEKDRGDVS